jgi:hypothetical protein
MPFFIDGNPSPSEVSDAVNYLLSNFTQNVSADPSTGQIIGPTGSVNGYLYKYMFVKYADSFDGTVNFSNSPTGRSYYGLRNSDSGTESTNPADYLWTLVTPSFGTTYFLYYLTSGGRTIQFQVATSVPNAGWIVDGGSAIDLDITNSTNAVANFVVIRTANNSAAPTNSEVVSAIGRTPISGDIVTVNYNSGAASIQYKYSTGWTFFQKYITADIVQAATLSAFTANLGTVTAGELIVTAPASGTPTISGTTMTGVGTHLYNDGRFALGNSTSNIVFNGTNAYLNGFTATAAFSSTGGSGVFWPANTQTYQEYSNVATLNSLDANKPIFVFSSGQLGLGCSSVGNSNPPARVDVTYQLEYQYSTNNGGTYSAWASYGIPIRIYAISANYTTISGYNRNFFADGSSNFLQTPAANTTNLKYRLNVTYVAYGDINASSTGYFGGVVTGSLTQVDTTYTAYSISTFQIKA